MLNLVGLTNPIGSAAPNYVVWGTAAGWSSSYYVVWGTSMQSPDGEYVVWGTSDTAANTSSGAPVAPNPDGNTPWPPRPDLRSRRRPRSRRRGRRLGRRSSAIHSIASLGAHIPLEWIAFSLLTFASGIFTLKIPSIDALLSVSEIFAFSCVLLFGPELGAITVTVDALLLSLRARHAPRSRSSTSAT